MSLSTHKLWNQTTQSFFCGLSRSVNRGERQSVRAVWDVRCSQCASPLSVSSPPASLLLMLQGLLHCLLSSWTTSSSAVCRSVWFWLKHVTDILLRCLGKGCNSDPGPGLLSNLETLCQNRLLIPSRFHLIVTLLNAYFQISLCSIKFSYCKLYAM